MIRPAGNLRTAGVVLAVLLIIGAGKVRGTTGGEMFAIGTIVGAGCWFGEPGIRFGLPAGIAVLGYWWTADAVAHTEFFATCAQVVPVLILAAAVEQRDVLRDAAADFWSAMFLGTTFTYMVSAEIVSLYAVAACKAGDLCTPTPPAQIHLLQLSLTREGGTLVSIVVAGLGGGIASIIVAALLPRRLDRPEPTGSTL